MSAQFTPGPWAANDGSVGRRVFMPDDVVEVRAEGGLVACLYGENWPGGQDAANANLIAAAPELYEALGAFGELWTNSEAWGDQASIGKLAVKYGECMKTAMIALAKARGETK